MIERGALETLISEQITAAMKARDQERTGTLRLIKTALMNKAIEKRAPLTQADSEQVLASMIKQRRDSIEHFTRGNRPELAAKESAEIALIEEFLPKAAGEDALAELVNEAVAEITSSTGQKPGPKDMGVVIKAVQAKLQASGLRAEGRTVSDLVKKSLVS
ncbi:MAG TPA: GatB/YqeY domain-containing protein [Terracidiphilus sp.]